MPGRNSGPRIARVIRTDDTVECVVLCRGWTLNFHCEVPLGQKEKLAWEDIRGDSFDDRLSPMPPQQPLRPLTPLTKAERHAAKKLAIGALQSERERFLKAIAEAYRRARREIEEPSFL
jgi:hypothetical protein